MSLVRVNALRDLQEELRWPLMADPFFSDIGVVNFRTAELETEINRMLGVLTEVDGKCGACVVVLPITGTDRLTDASQRYPHFVRVTFRVLEVPLLNMGPSGTGKNATAIRDRICQLLKHYEIGGFASPLIPDDPTWEAVEEDLAPVAWDVRFTCWAGVDQIIDKPSRVVGSYSDVTGDMTLSCGTPDVTIYYTLDGTFPFTSARAPNPSAQIYTGPLELFGEWTLRVAAHREGSILGDATLFRSTDISAMQGDGSSIGGLN